MTTRRTLARSIAAVLVVAAMGTPAAAHDHDAADPEPKGPTTDRTAATRTDTALVAEQQGWTTQAASRHLEEQTRFGALVDRVREAYPRSFAAAVFAEAPGQVSELRFAGEVPDGVRALADRSGVRVETIGGQRYNEEQLQRRALALVEHLEKQGHEQATAAVLPDGTIEAAVKTTGRAPAVPEALRESVRLTATERDVAVDLHTYGGAYIHGDSTQCTSGFTVESIDTGTLGVATAAHCTGMNHYHQPEGGPSYDMDWEGQHLGLWGDVEWHTTSHYKRAEYYADVGERRDVDTVETSAAVNNTYCVYSRMQGQRTCDQVYSTYVVQVSGSGVTSNLVAMKNNNVVGGDSGGPWSYSTEAAGVTKGYIWLPFKYRDTWSKAWLFDTAIGVEVLTQ